MNTGTDTRGFTIIELLITMVLGVAIVGALLAFTTSTMRNLEANRSTEEIARSARFLGMTLERDLQETGVSLASTPVFGSLAAVGDTVVTLHIPYEPAASVVHSLVPPAGTDNPLPPGGTCGATCVTVDVGSAWDLAVGDVARLQVNGERRLILVQNISVSGSEAQVTFTSDTEILGHPAGFAGGLLLDRFNTFVQKLGMTVYYQDGDRLMRADKLTPTAAPDGEAMLYGVRSWDATLLFVDGDEAAEANPTDTDPSNDYDDLIGIRINAELASDHPMKRDSAAYALEPSRTFEWRFAPRNLAYERNRLGS